MPLFVLRTNVKIANVREVVSELSALGSTILAKPVSYMSVQYAYDEHLAFGGTFDPNAMLSVTSIGKISAEENKKHCEVLFKFVGDKLGVPGDRVYIMFTDPGADNIGYMGTTITDLFAGKK